VERAVGERAVVDFVTSGASRRFAVVRGGELTVVRDRED